MSGNFRTKEKNVIKINVIESRFKANFEVHVANKNKEFSYIPRFRIIITIETERKKKINRKNDIILR